MSIQSSDSDINVVGQDTVDISEESTSLFARSTGLGHEPTTGSRTNIYALQQNLTGRRFVIPQQQTLPQQTPSAQATASVHSRSQSQQPARQTMSNPTPNTSINIRAPEPSKYNGDAQKLDIWLYGIKLYFSAVGWDINDTNVSPRCASFAAALLEGPALQWHHRQSIAQSVPTTFASLEAALRQQFGVLDAARRARDQLKTLQQKGNIQDYIRKFENIVMHLPTATTDELLHAFIFGLKDNIRTHVLLQRPTTLNDAQTQALTLADRTYVLGRNSNSNQSNDIVPMELGHMNKSRRRRFNKHNSRPRNASNSNERRNAHGKQSGPANNRSRGKPPHPCKHCGGQHWNADCPQRQNKSLNNMSANSPDANDNSHQVDFLVDSGASANFISESLVQLIGSTVKDCASQEVKLPNGDTINSSRYIHTTVIISGIQLPPVRFYLLPIKPTVVLGMEFLVQRAVVLDFASLKFSFKYQGHDYEVLGHPDQQINHTDEKALHLSNLLATNWFRTNKSVMKKLLRQPDNQAFFLLQRANVTQNISPLYTKYTVAEYPQLRSMFSDEYILQCVQSAISALNDGKKLAHITCPHCFTPHLDNGQSVRTKSTIHQCQACKRTYKVNECDLIGNPLAQFLPTLSKGRLELSFFNISHKTQQSIPVKFVESVRDIHRTHKQDIDQFVDNIFSDEINPPSKVGHSHIRNFLLINDVKGRDSYHRMYERTTFYNCARTNIKTPQVVAVNRFQSMDFQLLSAYLTTPSTYFLDNTFVVHTQAESDKVINLVRSLPHVYNSRIVLGQRTINIDAYVPLQQSIMRAGSPLLFILDQVFGTSDLPQGSLSHILSVSNTQTENALRTIFKEYSDVFPEQLPMTLPHVRDIDDVHHIKLTTDKPIYKPPYKTGPSESALIKSELDAMLEAGVIRPSRSPYSSPVLLVKKKDGSVRFCVDYRSLNEITIKDRYPIPRVDELFDKLSHARYFTSLDLRSGYWQLRMNESDIPKTSFCTRFGQFEFLVMPFGLCNAPSSFQRVMNNMFKDHLDKSVLVYLDDILIFSRTFQQHIIDIRQILDLLRKFKFYVKLKKCEFFAPRIQFLGHTIDADGLHIHADKIQVVLDWPTPRNMRDVQCFLGFAQYFRIFIQSFSEIALPLTALTKKDVPFVWSKSCENAFATLKQKLSSAPVLKIFDPDGGPVELHTDASNFAIGGILYQAHKGKLQPVAFHSRKLSSAEVNYTTTEKELLAIVDACRHWRQYLYGSAFTVRTDHRPLQYFFSQPNLSPRQIRWAEYLSTFQPGLRILYLAGKSNVPADALTRKQCDLDIGLHPVLEINALAIFERLDVEQLRLLQQQDPLLKGVHRIAASKDNRYHYRDQVLYTYDNQLVIPSALVQQLLDEYHQHSGHFGIRHMINKLKTKYWFPRLEYLVTKYVKECDTCQRIKPRSGKIQGLLMPLPVPQQPWQHLAMDFMTDLPVNSQLGTSLLVVVDRFSKMAHIIELPADTTATTVAQYYLNNIVRLHGVPDSIVSDRDPRFVSRFWSELQSKLGTSLRLSTAFHPQTDGQTERTIRTIEQLLRAYIQDSPQKYFEYISQVEFCYNLFPTASTGVSPFKCCYGYEPKLPIDLALETDVPSVQDMLTHLSQVWKAVRDKLATTALNMQRYANQKRKDVQFQEGDFVMLSTQNLNLPSFTSKLKPRFVGPFRVARIVNAVTCKLDLPDSLQVHPVFHVSLLKKYVGTPPVQPDPIIIDGNEEFEVQAIVAHRLSRRRLQLLVRWKGYDASSDEWLSATTLGNCRELVNAYCEQHGLERVKFE